MENLPMSGQILYGVEVCLGVLLGFFRERGQNTYS